MAHLIGAWRLSIDPSRTRGDSRQEGKRDGRAGSRAAGRALLAATISIAATLGCAVRPSPPPAAPPVENYVVGAPDQLRVYILPDPIIERTVRVRPDGKISIDLIGDVQAAGRTPQQIASAIQEQIGRFKRDAAVSVSVMDSPSQFVTVYGEVGIPSTFALGSEMRVSEAIGRVGGTKPFASQNKIRIVRTVDGKTRVLQIRLKDIARGDLATNVMVQKGDLIVVPPTVLARIGYAMQMVFFPFQPVVTAGTSAGAIAAGATSISGGRR